MPQPGHAASISSNLLVAKLRERRRQILRDYLSPRLLREYQSLGATIRTIINAERDYAKTQRSPREVTFVGDAEAIAPYQTDSFRSSIYAPNLAISTKEFSELDEVNQGRIIDILGGDTTKPCGILSHRGEVEMVFRLRDLPEVRQFLNFVAHGGLDNDQPQIARTSMAEHKKKLIEFLNDSRMATRGQIMAATGIPEGSLSQLLREPEFTQMERGMWRLKEWPINPDITEGGGKLAEPRDYKVGDKVEHETYGLGTIISFSDDRGALKKLRIRFKSGERTFLMAKAKLKFVEN